MFLFGHRNYDGAFTVISVKEHSSLPFLVKEQSHGKQRTVLEEQSVIGGCEDFPRTKLSDNSSSFGGNSEELVVRRGGKEDLCSRVPKYPDLLI